MQLERTGGNLGDLLDKGIVIDAWARVSIVGIDLIGIEARVVVASIDTYLRYADAVSAVPTVSRPRLQEQRAVGELAAENAALRAQLATRPRAVRVAPRRRRVNAPAP